MRISMATRYLALPICAIILVGLLAPTSQAAVTIELGDYRAMALEFIQHKFGVSAEQAVTVLHRYEQMNGDRIIDRLELPEGAILDFVRVDGNTADPSRMVTYEGSGVLHRADSRLFYPALEEMLKNAAPEERAHVLANIRAAMERGWFVQTITDEQRAALMANNRKPGESTMRPSAVRRVRILVVLNNFPHWNDRSPAQGDGNYDQGGPREHPISEANNWHTPGGPLDSSDFDPVGLQNPSWSNTGIAPAGGTNASVSNHPRIEYTVDGRRGTTVDLRERWYDFLFNLNNPLSVTNYYYDNSHGNLRIDGDRSDIIGPLESHHILDRIPYLGGEGNWFAIQPGTPVIRPIPEPDPPPYGVPGLRGISADSGTDTIATLGYTGRVYFSSPQVWDPDASPPAWDDLDIQDRYVVDYDRYRLVTKTDSFDENDRLRVNIGGTWVELTADAGFNLDWDQGWGQTLLQEGEVLGSGPGNRLLSMCYYTHDHVVSNGEHMGSRPYQLRHLVNTVGNIDDIGGTVDDPKWHYDRPKPYDHDTYDHAAPNMGFFEAPSSTGGHTYQTWLSHLNQILVDNGIVPTGYDCTIHLYPSDAAAGQDAGGTSGPWSGGHVFIPNSAVVLPSDAGLYLTAHELGHALAGFPDLYDVDFYTNAWGVQPPLFECSMMGPYSVMAHGGRRVDAFLKALVGWVTPVAVTEDMIHAPVPEIEGTLEDPIVYKLPGRPFYIANNVPPDDWEEFFLVENRNRTGGDYYNDISPRGLYIYHVDLRFGQTDEWHPMVIVEQADGLYELERNPDGQWGDLEGDPFPGSTDNRYFTQLSAPHSYSHGWVSGMGVNQIRPAGVLQPGSSTDSFSRVANITDPGTTMYADLYVVPREVIVTQVPIPGMPDEVPQGAEDLLMMHLRLDNDSSAPNLSRGDVEIDTIRIDENGSSQNDADIDRVSLFDDTNLDGVFDPAEDTRLATGVFQQQTVYFTNLNYRIPLDEVRNLFVTYDVSPSADSSEGISLGAGIASFDYIRPEIPGAVQRRERQTITSSSDGLGDYRFPINSSLVNIIEAPDTITVTPISRAPVEMQAAASFQAINPGDVDVPILSLNFEVDQDRATVTRIVVDETGTINAVAHITSTKLFLDANADGQVDAGDTMLDETTFANVGGVERATFDIEDTPVVVTEGSVQSVLITASLSDELPLVEPPLTLIYSLADASYITLLQSEDIVSDENFPISSDEVSTPVPNDPPPAPQNLTATAQTDGSILLNWDLSTDDPSYTAGEDDVTEYHIYRSTDPAQLVNADPADMYASVPAGETEFTDTNVPLGVDLYYMVRAYDGVQEGPNSNIAGPVQATDQIAPVFSDFDPAQGAQDVPRETTIAFTVTDNAAGIDQSTLVFEVNGVDVADDPNTTITGSARQIRVEYDPPTPFDYEEQVQVRLQIADTSGNVSPGADQFVTDTFTIEGAPIYFIAGVITDPTGAPVEGVQVTVDGQSDVTNAQGQYRVENLSAGTYTVTPSMDDRSFEPESRVVTVGPSATTIDFTARRGYDISGVVRTTAGDPLAGVTISDGQHAAVSAGDGTWAIEDIPAGTYTLTAQLAGYVFTPATQEVTVNLQRGDATNVVFTAAVETFAVSGVIETVGGDRLAGVTVNALDNGNVVASAQTNASGAYVITGLTAGTYVVRPEHTAYQFDPTETTVNVAADVANVDFTAAWIYRMTLPQGLAMVAVPVTPVDPDVQNAFGNDVAVARWDPQTSPPYLTAPSTNPMMELAPGRGFWTNSPTQRTVEIAGELFPATADYTLALLGGWNMAGNPYDRDLPWEQVSIPANSPAAPYGFIYDRTAGTYRLVSTAAGLGGVTVVPRNAGFWMRAGASTQVTIQAPGAAAASAEVAATVQHRPADDAWMVPVVARAAGVMDASSFAGVLPQAAAAPDAYRVDNPPAIGPYVDVYFVAENGRRLAVDVRGSAGATEVWPFAVTTDMAGTQVEVLLPDLSEVPADKSVILVDEDTGRRMYARTMTCYRYDSGEGGTRHFRLEIVDRGETGLMITSAGAVAGAGGVSVSYTLSAPARVTVEVLNIAGRVVATIGGDVAPAGVSTVAWNARSSTGTVCPAGRYLVRISARAEDGQQVQALVPVALTR